MANVVPRTSSHDTGGLILLAPAGWAPERRFSTSRAAPVPRVREEGASSGFYQVVGAGRVNRHYVPTDRHRHSRSVLLIFGNRPRRSFGRVAGTNLNSRALAVRWPAISLFAPPRRDHTYGTPRSLSCAGLVALARAAVAADSKRCCRPADAVTAGMFPASARLHLDRWSDRCPVPWQPPLAQIERRLPESAARGFQCCSS